MNTKRSMFLASLPLLALGAMMVPGTACEELQDAVCCEADDFQVGGSVSLAAAGNDVKAQAALQAIADLGGVASVMISDLTAACRSIAVDLEAPSEDLKKADGQTDANKKAEEMCNLAVSRIASFKGKGSISIDFQPPKCEASFAAQAECSAKCKVDANCDATAKLPECKGGSLQVSCSGECTAKADAPKISCEGSCEGTCEGSCSVETGVKCDGKCEGTCEGDGGAGTSGVDANGNCKGTCKGTCTGKIEGKCTGTCNGKCTGSCKATPGSASVKCDGDCKGKAEPIECKGGKLEAQCKVDANCSGSCEASVSAKAQCSPPELAIKITGVADAQLAKLRATLKANFGAFVTIHTKLNMIGKIDLKATVNAFGSVKLGCIPAVVKAAESAGANIATSVSVSTKVLGSVSTK